MKKLGAALALAAVIAGAGVAAPATAAAAPLSPSNNVVKPYGMWPNA
ncbi:hypothetical protein MUK71_05300 [Arthrobacter zhangbolii]|uniref:Chitinase n=1 Tax=Arthrobacter zhangbolii TaxID=2886936 RepID=A0ABY4DNR7_9MICC|nr:hypothetical protein [Arthrobacter zhangbolii]UON93041.1 hypothetical protein MUK71_05300 [Arthrobacter zhangbolii]